MSVHSTEPKFYSSSIVGGIIPIALGVAKSIKLNVGVSDSDFE